MSGSDLVTPQHLARTAMIFIRQSSPHQSPFQSGGLRLHYALQQRAENLASRPHDLQIIDTDLGQTASSAQHRQGFKEVLVKVTPGRVGIILSPEVTRLSRDGNGHIRKDPNRNAQDRIALVCCPFLQPTPAAEQCKIVCPTTPSKPGTDCPQPCESESASVSYPCCRR